MSIVSKTCMNIMNLVGNIDIFSKERNPEEELAKAKEYHAKHPFQMPTDKRAFYTRKDIAGYPCLIIRQTEKANRKAILYLHGGLQNIWKSEISIARNYGKRSEVDVWYPIYPAIMEAPLRNIIDVIYEMYHEMVVLYGAENCAVVGGSIGGFFALQLVNMINEKAEKAIMPKILIALSPGGVPDDEAGWAAMERYSQKDPVLKVSDVRMKEKIIHLLDPECPKRYYTPSAADFTGAPPTFIFYAEETCAGNVEGYRKAYEKAHAGEKLHMHIEPNLMHCYAIMPIFRESRRDYYKQIRLLKKL